jgi:hypothetical protein
LLRDVARAEYQRPVQRSLLLSALLVTACGSPQTLPSSSTSVNARSVEPAARPPDTMSVSGLRGTLSQHEIAGALDPKLPKFLRCVQQRLGAIEALAGSISFSFEVATNGSVVSVSPTSSTLGDRATERCMLAVAEATRFPAPHGGPADFTWPLEVPIDADVRPPVELDPSGARAALGPKLAELPAQCGGGQVIVTAYVDPDGSVLAAGVAAPDVASAAQLDCVSEALHALRMPSPGSYLGKVSFTIP